MAAGLCYTGCDPVTPNVTTGPPFHHTVTHLVMTGAGPGLHGLLVGGAIAVVAGALAVWAEDHMRKSRPT